MRADGLRVDADTGELVADLPLQVKHLRQLAKGQLPGAVVQRAAALLDERRSRSLVRTARERFARRNGE